ncbi:MAG: hypothetical protein MZV65_28780 [Chromatiales bacterium]|nr:hypothetical protein [Chromatiales bacterium]
MGVLMINGFWLLPLAVTAFWWPWLELWLLLIAYAPLLWLACRLDAGKAAKEREAEIEGPRMDVLNRLRSRTVIFIHDLVMVPIAWMCAYWLRFNLSPLPDVELQASLHWLPFVVLLQGAVFRFFGLYRGVWRFASIPDLILIGKSVAMGVLGVGLDGLFL